MKAGVSTSGSTLVSSSRTATTSPSTSSPTIEDDEDLIDYVDAQIHGEPLEPPPLAEFEWDPLRALYLLQKETERPWHFLDELVKHYVQEVPLRGHQPFVKTRGGAYNRKKRVPNVQEFFREGMRLNASFQLVKIRFAKKVLETMPLKRNAKERVYHLTYVGKKAVEMYER
jgi:hypothetical protein